MNIIVLDYAGGISCRPDTTWERENKDIFLPDFVPGCDFTPALFARIFKAGKCVGERFATRYYDAISYGMLLYPWKGSGRQGRAPEIRPAPAINGDELVAAGARKSRLASGDKSKAAGDKLAAAKRPAEPDGRCYTIMDHTSILPFPMYNRVTLESGENRFVLNLNGKEIFSTSEGSEAIIEEAIVRASELISIRIGDIVAIELAAPAALARFDSTADRKTADCREASYICATFCDNPLFDFKLQ